MLAMGYIFIFWSFIKKDTTKIIVLFYKEKPCIIIDETPIRIGSELI